MIGKKSYFIIPYTVRPDEDFRPPPLNIHSDFQFKHTVMCI